MEQTKDERPNAKNPGRVGNALAASEAPPLWLRAAGGGVIVVVALMAKGALFPGSALADYQNRTDCAEISQSVWSRPTVALNAQGGVDKTDKRWAQSEFYCAGQAETVRLNDELNEPTVKALRRPAPQGALVDGLAWRRSRESAKRSLGPSLEL